MTLNKKKKKKSDSLTLSAKAFLKIIIRISIIIIGPEHDKSNKMICAPSEDSDHPGHPPSLNCLRCLNEETLGPQLPMERAMKTLIRLSECLG